MTLSSKELEEHFCIPSLYRSLIFALSPSLSSAPPDKWGLPVPVRSSVRQEHFLEVIQNQEFLLLPTAEIVKLLSSDDINVPDEETIFQALMMWVRYDVQNRQQDLGVLLAFIRLPLLPPQVRKRGERGRRGGGGGIKITPAPLPGSEAVMNLLCPQFIKILFFIVNKPREHIQNVFFSPHCYLNIYAGFVLLCM